MSQFLMQLKEKVKHRSRQKKDSQFYEFCQEDAKILDVGISPERTEEDRHRLISANHFLKGFRYKPEQYVGLSIEPVDGMEQFYPGKKFVEYDGGRFPFEDNEFDWAYSNAVIEHVGTYEQKLHFVKEMKRVAKNIFITTPNKYFPVDAHTLVFFLHWNDKMFSKWREKNNNWWPQETLNLLSRNEINTLMKEANIEKYHIQNNRLLGMTMTFSVSAAV